MPLTPEQLAMIQKKDRDLTAAQRRNPLSNYLEGYYHITLNVRDEAPVLGFMAGRPDAPVESPDAPRVVLTELGELVQQSWNHNPEVYPDIENIAFQVMPEHIHGLVYLKPGNRRHLGQIVQGFMIGCTHAYWDTLGIPWRDMTYQKGVRTPQYNDRHHTRSYRGPALFVRGYNDVQAITAEEVAIKIAYIRSNPERRIIKQQRPDIFCIHSNQQTHSWTEACLWATLCSDRWLGTHSEEARKAWLSIAPKLPRPEGSPQEPTAGLLPLVYVGDKALLGAKRKVSLICHRADSALFEQQREAVLTAARSGAVVVSAFISPKEREIMKQLMIEQLPIIEILDNGISERYKPGGKSFYATAERRLVQISPWHYIYSRNTRVSRPMCLVMNQLARIVSGCGDGWWKEK